MPYNEPDDEQAKAASQANARRAIESISRGLFVRFFAVVSRLAFAVSPDSQINPRVQIVRISGLQICVLGRTALLFVLRRVRHVDLAPICQEQHEVEALANGLECLLTDGSAVRALELSLSIVQLQFKKLAVALPRSSLRRLALRGAFISLDDARDLARAFAVSDAACAMSRANLTQRGVRADESDFGGDRVRILLFLARRRRSHRLRRRQIAAARAARTGLCGRNEPHRAACSRSALSLAAALAHCFCHALRRSRRRESHCRLGGSRTSETVRNARACDAAVADSRRRLGRSWNASSCSRCAVVASWPTYSARWR